MEHQTKIKQRLWLGASTVRTPLLKFSKCSESLPGEMLCRVAKTCTVAEHFRRPFSEPGESHFDGLCTFSTYACEFEIRTLCSSMLRNDFEAYEN